MFSGWAIVLLALAYVGVLFAIAWAGDRYSVGRRQGEGRPMIYALSLAVYCTSWTFFGSVGLAAATGYDFVPVYIGPIIMFLFAMPLVQRIVSLAKSQNITSVSDFIAARYGKSPAVAAIVTIIAVIGSLPYIALQLKAIVISTDTLLGGAEVVSEPILHDGVLNAALFIAMALAIFAMLFGTRHIDATEHQEGLMLAVAAESVMKLIAFLAVGLFVVVFYFSTPGDIAATISRYPDIAAVFGRSFHGGTWLTVSFLSFLCIILLPRQFHVTVVENNSADELRRARWLFPLYLVLINLFVVPIAIAGLLVMPPTVVEPDMYVLALPMSAEAGAITTFAYVGGLSAATAMVIVESVALSIMICNGLVTPFLLRHGFIDDASGDDLAGKLLVIRRAAIFFIVLGAYAVYQALGRQHGLAAIGLLSFAAIAQLAPAFFAGLVWRGGTARGAIAGLLAGISIWGYTLLLPWVVKAGWMSPAIVTDGPFGIALLRPQALFFLEFEPLTHGVLWSLSANIACYIAFSLFRAPEPIERMQAQVFVRAEVLGPPPAPAFRMWRTSVTVGDLQATVARYLGHDRALRSLTEYMVGRGAHLEPQAEADLHLVRFTEHLLSSAIGAASARLVLSLLLRRKDVGSQSALKLLDDASEALQHNRDLLQSALDQVRHGLGVFDRDLRLTCWNRQFRQLLSLPPEQGRVGVSLADILRTCAVRGDFGPGHVDALVADRLAWMTTTEESFEERFDGGATSLEIRAATMPQGGIVVTIANITERVKAAMALAQANETLERRVDERTAALTEANTALAVAKAKADRASLDKTRFLAAASHDILQPLNAARLYATSLVEQGLPAEAASVAGNVDASLGAVEDILEALLDISRMDAGRIEPLWEPVSLNEMFASLRVEFEPAAGMKNLDLRFVPTSAWVRSDRRLLHRMLQNLISNAVKYTDSGGVLIGVRRRAGRIVVAVHDTGSGIEASKQSLIFEEFQRLDPHRKGIAGLGLGLSIVDRISRVLNCPVSVVSRLASGSAFSISLEAAPTGVVATAQVSRPPSEFSPLAGCDILCIDNESAVLEGMRTLLAGWGCTVSQARSIDEALAVVRAAPGPPSVILADYHLDDETGTAAVRRIEAECRFAVPAVIITADRSATVASEVEAAGHLLLHKPLKAAALRSALSQMALRRNAAE